MSSRENDIVSNTFEILPRVDVSTLEDDVDRFQSSLSLTSNESCYNYLRMTVGEPLSCALVYVITHRPNDPIEFIAQFLIKWIEKSKRMAIINEEKVQAVALARQQEEEALIREQEKLEKKRLMLEYQQKQREQFVIEYDKRLLMLYNGDFPIDSRTDDERETSMNFRSDEEERPFDVSPLFNQSSISTVLHTHETGSGLDDSTANNKPSPRLCDDPSRPSSMYFSTLKDRILQCHQETSNSSKDRS